MRKSWYKKVEHRESVLETYSLSPGLKTYSTGDVFRAGVRGYMGACVTHGARVADMGARVALCMYVCCVLGFVGARIASEFFQQTFSDSARGVIFLIKSLSLSDRTKDGEPRWRSTKRSVRGTS